MSGSEPTTDDEFIYSELAAGADELPFYRSGYRHGCRDERRKVIAELRPIIATLHTIHDHCIDADCDGECAAQMQEDATAAFAKVLGDDWTWETLAASLLAPEGEGIEAPIEKPTQPASPSPEQAREGDDVPTYELGAAGARFVTAEDEPWVNAIIEITVPLDGVSVDDERGVKQDAVGELHAELADVLPDSFAQCVSASHWEDVAPAVGGGTRPHEEGSTNG